VSVAIDRASSQSLSLQNDECVAVVGGGPAGSFFAIHLLREARRLNRRLDVVIVEKRGPIESNSARISAEQFKLLCWSKWV